MKRYVICPVVGSGTEMDPYRSNIARIQGVSSVIQIPSNPDGTPKYAFGFGIAATTNIALVSQALNTFVFPDFPLDAQMSGMGADVRLAMNQSVHAYILSAGTPAVQIDMSFYDDSWTYRDVLNHILHVFEPTANINNYDVTEPA